MSDTVPTESEPLPADVPVVSPPVTPPQTAAEPNPNVPTAGLSDEENQALQMLLRKAGYASAPPPVPDDEEHEPTAHENVAKYGGDYYHHPLFVHLRERIESLEKEVFHNKEESESAE